MLIPGMLFIHSVVFSVLTQHFSFGGPANVARTVWQYERAGVAGMHIEDQVQTKRCGHLLGKQVVSREEFVTRIRAAVIARDQIPGGSDFVSLTVFYRHLAVLICPAGDHWANRFSTGFRYGRGHSSIEVGLRRRCRCVLH